MFFKRLVVLVHSFLVLPLLVKNDSQVDSRLVMSGIYFEGSLVGFLRFEPVSFLLVNIGQVEESVDVVWLFVQGNFQMLDGLISILLLVVEHDAEVKPCLEVLRVGIECPLVISPAGIEVTLADWCHMLDACGNRVQGIDILRVVLENLQINLSLRQMMSLLGVLTASSNFSWLIIKSSALSNICSSCF